MSDKAGSTIWEREPDLAAKVAADMDRGWRLLSQRRWNGKQWVLRDEQATRKAA